MVVTRFHHSWSRSIKFVQLHTGDGLTGDQNHTNSVSVGIGWGIGGSCLFSFKNMQKQVSSMHQQCARHAKGTQKRKKVKPYLKLIYSLFSREHGLRDIGFGGSPIGYAGFMSCFKVQGNFLLLCSSSNFVGYSHIYIYMFQVPGPPPHPPCHGHGHNPSTPPLPLWNAWALGRGGGHPTSNQQQCNW